MPLVQCTACKRFVLPKDDGTCPSCSAATSGAPSVSVAPMAADEAAAWRRHDEEKRERGAAAAALRTRGQALTIGGAGLAAIAGLVSILTLVAAADAGGGTYVVWTGGLVAGLAMVVRGRGIVARAKRLDDR